MFQQKGLEFYLHHALVLLNYIDVLKTGTMQYYAAKDGLVEGTNVPLCLVILLRMFGRTSHPLYTVNGILLWASYIPLRLVNLPMMVYQWIQDLSTEEGKEVEKKHYPSEVHGSTNDHNSMDFVLFVDEADYCWSTKAVAPH